MPSCTRCIALSHTSRKYTWAMFTRRNGDGGGLFSHLEPTILSPVPFQHPVQFVYLFSALSSLFRCSCRLFLLFQRSLGAFARVSLILVNFLFFSALSLLSFFFTIFLLVPYLYVYFIYRQNHFSASRPLVRSEKCMRESPPTVTAASQAHCW